MAERLRRLLHLDLGGLSWREALVAVAQEARSAFESGRALLALREPDHHWTAVTPAATWLQEKEISLVASLSVLNEVWTSGQPLVAAAQVPLGLQSRSLDEQKIRQVMCVPLRWWECESTAARRSFGGALYVDRREGEPGFAPADIELALDFAALTERLLSLMRSLDRSRLTPTSATQIDAQRTLDGPSFTLGKVSSREPVFIERVLQPLAQAARAERVNVLLLGPSGSGKTHLAHAFHLASSRGTAPFVVFDCGQSASEEALAAELFGYAPKSGFAAPSEGRAGKAHAAHGGTLFVDEIGALPLSLQSKLLRLVQDGHYTPLGAAQESISSLAVVSATNAGLAEMVEAGRFRADLYWRLAELSLELPHLDERPADVPALAREFLVAIAIRARRPASLRFSEDAVAKLVEAPWRRYGNLRGLQNALTRAVLQLPGDRDQVRAEDLVFERAGALGGSAFTAAAPVFRRDRDTLGLRELLAVKIEQYSGNLRRMCSDVELARCIDDASPPIAYTSLRVLIRKLDLAPTVETARQARLPRVEQIVAALEQHGTVNAAAEALDLTRDMLVWQLRRAGLSVRQLRGQR